MRQVYASARLENVEAVAKLLNEAGIDTWISGGRSYKGKRRSQFSFREDAQADSAVWIVKSEDISRATAMMREAGLLQSTRDSAFVPSAGRLDSPAKASTPRVASRLRLVLLAIVAVLALLSTARMWPG